MENNLDEHFEALGLRIERSPDADIHNRALQYGFLYGPKNNELYKLGFGLVLPSSITTSNSTSTTLPKNNNNNNDDEDTTTINSTNDNNLILPTTEGVSSNPSPLALEAEQLSTNKTVFPLSFPVPSISSSSSSSITCISLTSPPPVLVSLRMNHTIHNKNMKGSLLSPPLPTVSATTKEQDRYTHGGMIRRNSYPLMNENNSGSSNTYSTIVSSSSSSSSFLLSPLSTIHAANQLMRNNSPTGNTATNVSYLHAYDQVVKKKTNLIPNLFLSSTVEKSEFPTINRAPNYSAPSTPIRRPAIDNSISSSSCTDISITVSTPNNHHHHHHHHRRRRKELIYGALPSEFASPRYITKEYGNSIIHKEEKYRIHELITSITGTDKKVTKEETNTTVSSSPIHGSPSLSSNQPIHENTIVRSNHARNTDQENRIENNTGSTVVGSHAKDLLSDITEDMKNNLHISEL